MNVWQFIYDKLTTTVNVILIYVLESKGSSPGRQGFKMAVAEDGSFFGTIGGGIMEHKFVEMAKSLFQEDTIVREIVKQVHDKSSITNQSGMICSGEQTIFLYKVQQQDISHIANIIDTLKYNKNGTLQLGKSGIFFSDSIPLNNFYFEQSEAHFILEEKIGYKNHLHIIGGGHCALAFSKLMRGMDFYIHVYEEREGLNTFEQNVFAHEKILLNAYSELKNIIKGGDNEYIVIMTFGYRSDDKALRAILGKDFKYIGMLGSRKKMEKMFIDYRGEKIDEKILKNIYAPVGIQIKSQTPEEIAVSIAAEIIAVKNKDQ